MAICIDFLHNSLHINGVVALSNLALYRKYRSQNFSQLLGQEHITKGLESAVKSGRISHAYLFSGPRGVGKTSAARILAKKINGLPEDLSMDHLDIIEIDGASNRRIDEVRDLREKVHIAPAQGKYKVYVIDEVHMLTTEAFNALLKTLEEPPSHVVFILATTEPHKLPETIVSRTQHFNFKPIEARVVTKHLASIAKSEDINIAADALELIAASAKGSFRDAISILDQLPRKDAVDIAYLRLLLGIPEHETIYAMLGAIISKQPQATLDAFDSMVQAGTPYELIHSRVLEALQSLMRSQLNIGTTTSKQGLALANQASTEQLSQIVNRLAGIPKDVIAFGLALEATLIDLSLDKTKSMEPTPKHVSTSRTPNQAITSKTKPEPVNEPVKKAGQPESTPKARNHRILNEDSWLQVLSAVKQKNPSLFGLLKTAETEFNKNHVTLGFRFKFHLKRLEEPRNRELLQTVLLNITGEVIRCEFKLLNSAQADVDGNEGSAQKPNQEINAVLEILGGEVVNGK